MNKGIAAKAGNGALVALLLLLPFLHGCGGDEPVTPKEPALQINGRIVGAGNGKPLDSADVVLLFHTETETGGIGKSGKNVLDTEPTLYPNPATQELAVTFEVPVPGFVTTRILDPVFSDVAATPVSAALAAGRHTVIWNLMSAVDTATTVRNGWYHAHVRIDEHLSVLPVLVNAETSAPFAVTDTSGRFFIDYRLLPIDSTAQRITENGATLGTFRVTDSVTVVVRRRGYPTRKQGLKIDRSKPVGITVAL